MQSLFGPYVLINLAVSVSFLVVRRFPPGVVQWIVFTVGLADCVFLGGLTVLTNGFESNLYYIFPGVIVLNAICIPLAVPQIALNLALSGAFLAAGVLESDIPSQEDTVPDIAHRAPGKAGLPSPAAFVLDDITNLAAFATQLQQQSDPLTRYVWRRLSDGTREQLATYDATKLESDPLRKTLVDEMNRIVAPRRWVFSLTSISENPKQSTEPVFVLRLVVLWMLTFCCYGVQVLSARQQRAFEDQKEFIARTEQLRAAGRVAAEIAHKLKNPLGIINNALYSLHRAAREGRAVAPQPLQIIQEEVDHSDRILTQLMGYAQLAEGRVEKLDVARELDRAVQLVFPAGAGFAVEVKRSFATNLPPLWMQPGHFNEVFVNLLQNAREVLNGVGQIGLSAQLRGERDVEIVIEDNGPGVATDKRERIFEPYFTMREKGTGLGLAVVKHNVELYGGTVRVESELGKGARFIVLFPARSSLESSS
jgi:signal transduction histidine kinase